LYWRRRRRSVGATDIAGRVIGRIGIATVIPAVYGINVGNGHVA
jgi:hypothetical protein